ncbi:MAG: hypothetical protein CMM86_13355 [Rhodovulum sp.]|nr:hypothetical protein [Rhodovulum sp.]|tara:strand:+ start:8610 stop:8942 length:333 start_codon:yes stop_codon:yes gene_type:complete
MLNGQEYLTPTGERVLRSGDLVRIGPGDDIRSYTGKIGYLHTIKSVGEFVQRGEAVIVAEGENGAVELYAPRDGVVVWINAALENAPPWLVTMRLCADKPDRSCKKQYRS